MRGAALLGWCPPHPRRRLGCRRRQGGPHPGSSRGCPPLGMGDQFLPQVLNLRLAAIEHVVLLAQIPPTDGGNVTSKTSTVPGTSERSLDTVCVGNHSHVEGGRRVDDGMDACSVRLKRTACLEYRRSVSVRNHLARMSPKKRRLWLSWRRHNERADKNQGEMAHEISQASVAQGWTRWWQRTQVTSVCGKGGRVRKGQCCLGLGVLARGRDKVGGGEGGESFWGQGENKAPTRQGKPRVGGRLSSKKHPAHISVAPLRSACPALLAPCMERQT